MHYELPIGAFLAAALVLIPLPWHWRARNVPTLSIIAWLFISNVQIGVSAIIWADNINITARVWCDIATKLQVGATMALPACCLCLCIHLERIASVRQVRTTANQKHRRMLFDIALCWGLPVISMILQYVVQGHRFDIVEDFGCKPAVYVSIPLILLVFTPILVVVAVTLGFAGAALRHFFRRRLTFARHLQDSSSALTPSRYFRLMAMALVQMVWATFLTLANLVLTVRGGLLPYVSWAYVHADFSRVGVFPTVFIPADTLSWTYFTFWSLPATVVLFLVFFAFGQEAVKGYKAFYFGARRVLRIPARETKARVPSIPSFAPRFPQLDKKGSPFAVSIDVEVDHDADTATLHSSKGHIPLTPQSASSFATTATSPTIPPLKFDAGVQAGPGCAADDDARTYKTLSFSPSSSFRFSADAHDMA